MTLATLLIIVLLFMIVGGNYVQRDGQPYFGTGWQGGSLLGLVLVVLVVLFLTHNLNF